MRSLIVTALAGAIAMGGISLSGCTTTDAYTGQTKTSDTVKGAGIGAASGAVLAAAIGGGNSKDRLKRAAIGGVAGGAIGAGVGAYMDSQEKELREQLQSAGVSVQIDPTTKAITLVMPGNVLVFATGQSSVPSTAYSTLDAVAKVLTKYNKTTLIVAGFTDNVGRDDANLKLSQDRADSVTQYLSTRGIAGDRITSRGYGKAQPIASNSTKAGQAQNRRVEIHIDPPASV
jgi:outer membrane protein OmpA-like peptidoglycan-associated protein